MSDNKNKDSSRNGVKNGSPIGPASSNTQPPETPTATETENAPSTENETETPSTTQTPAKPKTSALDKMKQKNEASGGKVVMDKMERMNLFDSTKASEVKTKGAYEKGTIKMQEGGMMIAGRNVGAEQSEPDWSEEQKAFIEKMVTTKLPINDVTDSRRSVMDREMKYVARDDNGTIVPTEEGYVSALDTSAYCIGVGPYKYDVTGGARHYSDAVVAGIGGDWMLNQWTSEWVVIEGVAPDVFMKQHRVGSATQNNRRIGVNFARIGLPKLAFGPLFNSLSENYPGVMGQIVQTPGYYWTNASWGVSSFAATFSYMDGDGQFRKTSNLSDVMRMLGGKSSLSLATVAISITCPSKSEGDRQVPDKSTHGLSIKLHNAFGVSVVDYHGPPQQGATGMMIPKRFIQNAKSMSGSAAGGTGMGIFARPNTGTGAGKNLFGSGSQAVPSVKSDDNSTDMSQNEPLTETNTRSRSWKRVKEWIMKNNGKTTKASTKVSTITNIMHDNDVLVVVCPSCTTARAATRTEFALGKFLNMFTNPNLGTMTALMVSSYCDLVHNRCSHESKRSIAALDMSTAWFASGVPYEMMDQILGEVVVVPSNETKDEIVFLSSNETVALCRSMHRVPLKIGPEDATWPKDDDCWTDMNWAP
ncbi:uncharacterized protein LTR77_011243 [Saxophila tyrrhenica]|uniref:Capsid protein n=1 Tax=Saxophila tyrrhenica TaxID=1690608 RepID=A0AAV9NVQ9_9PEZI|nr:hypothetical protein LTR77_011243 [Saxophila tyrrhenica]